MSDENSTPPEAPPILSADSERPAMPAIAPRDAVKSRVPSSWWYGGFLFLALTAFVSQWFGLQSLVKYTSQRDSWEASKAQQQETRGEWESILKAVTADIAEKKSTAEQLTAKVSQLQSQRDSMASEFARIQGQHEALIDARDAALVAQRRAQEKEQDALDAVQNATQQIVEMQSSKDALEVRLTELEAEDKILTDSINATQQTLEKQKTLLTAQKKVLTDLEQQMDKLRTDLRDRNQSIIAASNELSVLQDAKQNAARDLLGLEDRTQQLSDASTQFTTKQAELRALEEEKAKVDSDLAVQQQRLAVAEKKLADYLQQWTSREKLIEEIEQLQMTRDTLVTENAKLKGEGQTLKTEQTTLETDIAAKTTAAEQLTNRLADLRKQEAALVGAVMSVSKEIAKPKGENGSAEDTNGENE